MAHDEEQSTVYLGYIESNDEISVELASVDGGTSHLDSSADQEKPWLINKIGGMPIFPFNETLKIELDAIYSSLVCKHCKSICFLIFQILSPIDDSPLDRIMQVYTCIKSDCIKHSWYTLRCMIDPKLTADVTTTTNFKSDHLELVTDPVLGNLLTCRGRAFFKPYYVSVTEEPTGREDFAKNNLEALKLASKFEDPDNKPASIEAKYKNLKNYKPPQPPANLSDLDDFEKYQMQNLYGNDKVMYRYYKRIGRYQSQIVRYDWEGQPLLNSSKLKLDIQPCSNCQSKRKFEFQMMSGLINYLKSDVEFDRESLDFSSIVVHSCAKNCNKRIINVEDTYFMPDPDSRTFNKVRQRMLALKLKDSEPDVGENSAKSMCQPQPSTTSSPSNQTHKKKKKKGKK